MRGTRVAATVCRECVHLVFSQWFGSLNVEQGIVNASDSEKVWARSVGCPGNEGVTKDAFRKRSAVVMS
jgi:hypothetical protein